MSAGVQVSNVIDLVDSSTLLQSSSPIRAAYSQSCLPVRPCYKRRKTDNHLAVLDKVPIEIIERIVSFCSIYDYARLSRVSRAFNLLLQSPCLYETVNVHPMPPRGLVDFVAPRLSSTLDFTSTSSSKTLLTRLLPNLGPNLRVLDVSFSCIDDDMLLDMAPSLGRLQELRLRGCRSVRDFSSLAPYLPDLRILDLSWSGVIYLPRIGQDLQRLRDISLSCAPLVSHVSIVAFLKNTTSLESIDLSHTGISFGYLRDLCDHFAQLVESRTSKLRTLDLRGIDLLTRSDVRLLRAIVGTSVEIKSNAMLDSDEIDDIRRFVGLWTGLLERKQAELRFAADEFA